MKKNNLKIDSFLSVFKENFLKYFIKFILILIFAYIFIIIVNKIFIPILIQSLFEYLQSDKIKNIIIKFMEIYIELSK